MATQKEIAEALGISPITVNRALNNYGYVSSEMKKRIVKYAEKINYTPHRAARSLVRKKRHFIAVLSTGEPSFFWDDISHGIQIAREQINYFGFKVEHYKIPYGNTKAYMYRLRTLISRGLEAVALVNNLEYDMGRIFRYLDKKNIPYITLNIDAPKTKRLCYIGPDYKLEGKIAADFLLKFASPGDSLGIIGSSEKTENIEIEGSHISYDREVGFREIVETKSNIDVIVYRFDREKLLYKTEKDLHDFLMDSSKSLKSIYLVYADEEILEVLSRCNKFAHLKVISPHYSPLTKEYLQKDIIDAIIYQNPILQGYYAVKILEHLIETGEKPEKEKNIIINNLMLKSNISLYENHYLFTRILN